MDEKLLQLTLSIFESALPDLKDILSSMDESNGSMSIDDSFLSAIPMEQDINWTHVYESPDLMKGLPILNVIDDEQANNFANQVEESTPESYNTVKISINEEIFGIIDEISSDSLEESIKDNEPEESLPILYSILPLFFNVQSVMTYGYSMTHLIKRAKGGDDKAFCNAIQIDRTLLFGIPYFRNRLLKIQLSDDKYLKNKLATAIKGKIHGKDVKHPLVWFLFSSLNDAGVLDLPISRLMEFCEKQGIYGHEDKHSDDGLVKLRQEYKNKTGDQI